MAEEPPVPPGVDPSQLSPARVYDFLLGGVSNFAADRAAADLMRSMAPELVDAAFANRGFHQRAAKWIAEPGVQHRFFDQRNVDGIDEGEQPGPFRVRG